MGSRPNQRSHQGALQPLPSASRPNPRMALGEFEKAQRDPKVQRAVEDALRESVDEVTGESTPHGDQDGIS